MEYTEDAALDLESAIAVRKRLREDDEDQAEETGRGTDSEQSRRVEGAEVHEDIVGVLPLQTRVSQLDEGAGCGDGAQPPAAAEVEDGNPFVEGRWLDEHGGLQVSLDEANKVLDSHSALLGSVGDDLRNAIKANMLSVVMKNPDMWTLTDVENLKKHLSTAATPWEAKHVSNPLEVLKKAAYPFHGRHVLMKTDTREVFNDRVREWPVEMTLLEKTCWTNAASLLVVAGESGSGKTFNALLLHDKDCIVLYLTLRDVISAGWKEDDVKDGISEGETAAVNRNELALRALRVAVGELVPEKIRRALKEKRGAERPKGFALIVDEVGGAPQLVKALCALKLNGERSRSSYLLGFFDDYPLRVVAVGTGVDAVDAQPGSLPETYTLVHMPSTVAFWKVIVDSAAQRATVNPSESRLSEALRRMAAYRPAADLATNARLAVLIAMHTQKAAEAIAAADGRIQQQQLMDQVLRAAVVEFRSLNGLSTMDRGSLSAALFHAVRLVMTHAASAGPPDTGDLAMTRGLCTELGILTDHARWVKALPSEAVVVLRREAGLALVAPLNAGGRCCRFQMSPAQLTLLHMMYGFNLPPAAGGGEFERLVARYLELVLIACRGLPVEELLQRIGMQGGPGKVRPALGKLEYSGVAVVKTPTLSPTTPKKTKEAIMKELAAQVGQGHAVVAINGDQAPFADVMVMVPGRLLVLVQCKNYGPETTWTRYSAYVELHKMGVVDRWALLADEVRQVSLAEARTKYPHSCPATMKTVPRAQIFEWLANLTSGEASDGTTPAGDFVGQLSVVVGGGAAVPVRHCLFTTKPALSGLGDDVLQMHATGETMWPLLPRAERDPAAEGAHNELMNLFLFQAKDSRTKLLTSED